MKYKNIDCTVENLREFRTSSEYKASFPKFFEFYVQSIDCEAHHCVIPYGYNQVHCSLTSQEMLNSAVGSIVNSSVVYEFLCELDENTFFGQQSSGASTLFDRVDDLLPYPGIFG